MAKKKIRVLIASETYPPSLNGCAIFTQRLAQNLSKSGHEVAVVVPGRKFGDSMSKDKYGVNIYGLRSAPVKFIHPDYRLLVKPNTYIAAKKIIKYFKPDIVHLQDHFFISRAFLKNAKERDIPIIGTNHFMPENHLQYVSKLTEKAISKILWNDFVKVYSQLDCVTAPSQAAVDMLHRIGYKKKAEVVSNGMEFDKFKKRRASNNLLKKYKISKDTPIFISVGRIEKEKNLDVVIEAFALYLKKNDGKLIFVGNGQLEKKLKKLVASLGMEEKVIFAGKIVDAEVEEIYSLADVYIGAGTAELQGLSAMEAMASGLPILAVNAVALPELVKNGENGYLFELSATDLAQKMDMITDDKQKLKKMAGKSLVMIKEHDIEKTIAKFECIYENVISEKKKTSK